MITQAKVTFKLDTMLNLAIKKVKNVGSLLSYLAGRLPSGSQVFCLQPEFEIKVQKNGM